MLRYDSHVSYRVLGGGGGGGRTQEGIPSRGDWRSTVIVHQQCNGGCERESSHTIHRKPMCQQCMLQTPGMVLTTVTWYPTEISKSVVLHGN